MEKEVKNILGKEITVKWEISDNQSDLFTNNHKRYAVLITNEDKNVYKNKSYKTEFQCNPQYTTPSWEEIMQAVGTDASCYDCSQNIDGFAADFYSGETKISKIIAAFEACKAASDYLTEVFGSDYDKFMDMVSEENFEEEPERE